MTRTMRRRSVVAVAIAAAAVGGVMWMRGGDGTKVLPTQILPQAMIEPFRMICPFTHINGDDPVAKFGQPGAAHPHPTGPGHLFFANPFIDAFTTFASASSHDGVCERRFGPAKDDTAPEPADSAGYWIPRPIFAGKPCTLNEPVDSKCPKSGAVAWYQNPDACPSARPCPAGKMPINYTFPPDFRMILGDSNATFPDDNPAVKSDNIFFNCYPAKGKTFGDQDPDGLNQCADLGGNRADVWMRFPPCWVGRGGDPSWPRTPGGWVLDSPDHISHVAYPDGKGCPASHPVVLPQLTVQVEFKAINGTDIAWSCGKWYCIHFDFAQWWHPDRFEALTAPFPPEPNIPSETPTPTPTATRTR